VICPNITPVKTEHSRTSKGPESMEESRGNGHVMVRGGVATITLQYFLQTFSKSPRSLT
jgi:hypothetical protein